jgi:hypothetical protein
MQAVAQHGYSASGLAASGQEVKLLGEADARRNRNRLANLAIYMPRGT